MTNYVKLYDAVKAEFNDEIALSVVQILTINHSVKPKKKDMVTKGLFRDKILKKSKKVLWEVDDDTYDLAVKIWDVVPSWETRQEFNGLGGCTIKCFKELLDDNNNPLSSKQYTWEEFEEKYLPIENQLDNNASLGGIMFETFGNELEYVKNIYENVDKNRIWTYVDGDDGEPLLISGFHLCNRIGYVITVKPFEDNVYIEVSESI